MAATSAVMSGKKALLLPPPAPLVEFGGEVLVPLLVPLPVEFAALARAAATLVLHICIGV